MSENDRTFAAYVGLSRTGHRPFDSAACSRISVTSAVSVRRLFAAIASIAVLSAGSISTNSGTLDLFSGFIGRPALPRLFAMGRIVVAVHV